MPRRSASLISSGTVAEKVSNHSSEYIVFAGGTAANATAESRRRQRARRPAPSSPRLGARLVCARGGAGGTSQRTTVAHGRLGTRRRRTARLLVARLVFLSVRH